MPSIQNLPNELIVKIAREILSASDTDFVNAILVTNVRDTASLSRFARTCKTFRDAAIPILYETVYAPSGYCISLVRTLIENSELAIWVRFLYMSESWSFAKFNIPHDKKNDGAAEAPWAISPEEAALFNKAIKSFQIQSPEAAREEIIYDEDDEDDEDDDAGQDGRTRQLISSLKVGGDLDRDEGGELTSILSTLAIVHCESLEHISLVMSYSDLAPANRVNFTFDHLEKLTVSHGDTEMSAVLGSGLQWIFDAAPELTYLVGNTIGGISEMLQAEDITSLVFEHSHFDENGLDDMYESFPNIEQFTFHEGGAMLSDEAGASPRQFVQLLSRWSKTLKCLDMSFEAAMAIIQGGWDDPDAYSFNLKSLTQLQKLQVGLEFFGFDEEDTDAEDTDAEFFRKQLPSSLETLKMNESFRKWNVEALLDTVSDDFPKLKVIELLRGKRSESDQERLREAFKSKGIDVKFVNTVV